jgi:hypothetical protein
MYLIRVFYKGCIVTDMRFENFEKATNIFETFADNLPDVFSVELYEVVETWKPLWLEKGAIGVEEDDELYSNKADCLLPKTPTLELADSSDEDDESWDEEDLV